MFWSIFIPVCSGAGGIPNSRHRAHARNDATRSGTAIAPPLPAYIGVRQKHPHEGARLIMWRPDSKAHQCACEHGAEHASCPTARLPQCKEGPHIALRTNHIRASTLQHSPNAQVSGPISGLSLSGVAPQMVQSLGQQVRRGWKPGHSQARARPLRDGD